MLEVTQKRDAKFFAYLVGAFTLLSILVTVWDVYTIQHEQAIVEKLIGQLEGHSRDVAQELAGELQFQSRLTSSLVLSVLAGAIAFSLALRGYFSSERNLEHAKSLSNDILASMDSAVMTTDLHGKILRVNPFGDVLLRLENGQLPQTLDELGVEHRALESMKNEVLEHRIPFRDFDYRIHQNGHRKTLRASCSLLKTPQNADAGFVFQIRDVTEKSLIEEQLRRMERYMGLGTLAAGLQHEIKNPLNALTLHLQLLEEHLETERPPDPEVKETLEVLSTEVRRITRVLDSFRNYASVHTLGRMPVDVPDLIRKQIRLLRPEAELKGIELVQEPSSESLGLIDADPTQLEQVFLNLAINGMAAMPNGGRLVYRIYRDGDSLKIDVTDTGIGIPPEHHAQLFDPYFTTRHDGTGMGLAICDKLVRQHGGNIDFSTGPGGTTFTIQLPVKGNDDSSKSLRTQLR